MIKAQELVRNSSTSERLESARGGEWALSNIDIKEEKKCDKMALTALKLDEPHWPTKTSYIFHSK